MNDFYRFPETIFASQNNFVTQCTHFHSEITEVIEAMRNDEPACRVAEEIVDAIHSLETALRILQRDCGIDASEIAAGVTNKNRERGYYGVM